MHREYTQLQNILYHILHKMTMSGKVEEYILKYPRLLSLGVKYDLF